MELDGVRGLAASLVVYSHLFLMWMPGTPAPVFWMRTLSGISCVFKPNGHGNR